MRRSHREPTRKARADTTEWLQLLRDSDYGRMNKVLNALQTMQVDDIQLVSGHVLVRSIERCTSQKLPILLQMIDFIATKTRAVNSQATVGGTTTYPLVRASYLGWEQVVARLLVYRAQVEHVAGNSASTMESCLSAATRSNKLGVLTRLLECFANDTTPVINGLLVQALWQAYEHNNVQACRMLIAHSAVVDNVFASVLHVLEEKEKFKRFLALAEGEMEIGPLQSTRPCPWYFPASYRRGVTTLFMCVRRIIDDFPVECFDHILDFLPYDPTLFLDSEVLHASLPRRDYTGSSCKFAILTRPRPKDGDPEVSYDEDGSGW